MKNIIILGHQCQVERQLDYGYVIQLFAKWHIASHILCSGIDSKINKHHGLMVFINEVT